MAEFVTTPTDHWLNSEIAQCKDRLLIASPYVGRWLPDLHRKLPKNVRSVLLTRADLRDFASGASDLNAVCTLASGGVEVICSHRLHAKVYVIDDTCGLITSANATYNGMRGNLECGVVIRDPVSVRGAADLILSGFGAKERPERWTYQQLVKLHDPVRQIRETLTPQLVIPELDKRLLPDIDSQSLIGRSLQAHLPGWTRLALEGVQLQSEKFDLNSFVAACMPMVANRYPNNQNARPKLRQQLQRLRDLGLIEFLGSAIYRRHI